VQLNTAQLGSRPTLLRPRQCDQVPIITRACIIYALIACIVTAVPLQIAILRASVRCLSMVGGDQDRPMHAGNKDESTPRLTKLAMPLSPPIALAVGENQHSLLIVVPDHSINFRLPLSCFRLVAPYRWAFLRQPAAVLSRTSC
jgi:hypothetical protein